MRLLSWVAVVFILLSPGLAGPGNQYRVARDILGDEVTIYQFFQNTQPLDSLLVFIPVRRNRSQPVTFTVFLDLDDDGKFETKEIAVDEIPAPVEKGLANGFPADFKSSNQLRELLDRPAENNLQAKIEVDGSTKIVTARKVLLDIGEVFDPAPGFTGGAAAPARGPMEGAHVPAGDGDKGGDKVPVSHDGVPDLNGRSGKPNECVPLSLANSLLWLAGKHKKKIGDKMPATEDALIDELATDVKWNRDGTRNENVLPGKDEFTRRRGLPLVNKRIDNEFKKGKSLLWEKIVRELNKGEDVELVIDFKDSPQGDATEAHMVTVVGADKTKKDEQTITFHDPATPEGNDTYEVDRNGQVLNYPLGKAYVNFIISESFTSKKPTPTPSPTPTSTPPPPSPTP